jgi:ATP phosphoribosyltransferase regulatory subunit
MMRPDSLPAAPSAGRLRPLFEAAGAEWLDLPVLQPAEAFLETAGEEVRRRMFVTEGRRGESLALRPDFTIPVCLHHLESGNGPARYAYEGLVFRRHLAGAPERLETGYEDIGRADRALADAEAVALAAEAVRALTGAAPRIRIGDIGLFVALLEALGLPQAWRRRLRSAFGVAERLDANLKRLAAPRETTPPVGDAEIDAAAAAHDRQALVALVAVRLEAHGHTPGAGRSAAEIAERFLNQLALRETRLEPATIRVLRDYLAIEAPLDVATGRLQEFARRSAIDLSEPIAAFAERAAALRERGADGGVTFSAAFGRPLDYYTGLVFELGVEGAAAPLAGGGRYDRLMEMLGAARPLPAVGFSLPSPDLIRGAPERKPS